MSVPGIAVDHRLIAEGDELALLAEELPAFAGSVIKVRRASGAARIVARHLLSRFGALPQAIRKSTAGMPVWPEGIVGSLAHDATIAVAAVAARQDFFSIGIDVEPAEPLDPDLLDIVATAAERERMQTIPRRTSAVLDQGGDLQGGLSARRRVPGSSRCRGEISAGTAEVRDGREVSFRHCAATHIVARLRSGAIWVGRACQEFRPFALGVSAAGDRRRHKRNAG